MPKILPARINRESFDQLMNMSRPPVTEENGAVDHKKDSPDACECAKEKFGFTDHAIWCPVRR